jgi:hypothetical protein
MKKSHTILLREYLEAQDDSANVIAYKEAGDELVDFVVRGEKYSWYEAFVRPIGYLYRHYLELELKYWIKILQGTYCKGHNLGKLWIKAKPLIQPFCETKEEKEFLKEIRNVVLIFHKSDPTGQEFRYTRTIRNTPTLKKLRPEVDVELIKYSIARVNNFFNGLSGVISAGQER